MADMTDRMWSYEPNERFDEGVCPVCGGGNTFDLEQETENDTYFRRMGCHDCGSEFTHTYWIANTLVTHDGRYGEGRYGEEE